MPAATAGSAARGEPGQRMKPSAHAPELDRELGVLGTGDAADLDARHGCKRSGPRRPGYCAASARRAVAQRRPEPACDRRRRGTRRRPRRPARGAARIVVDVVHRAAPLARRAARARRRRAARPPRRARRAGRRSTCTPVAAPVDALDAEVGALDVAGLLELRDHVLGGVDGTAKPIPTLPSEPLPVAICELIPITRPARVEQRAAGVARVERRVGLDDVVDREAARRGQAALAARRRRRW